MQTGGAQCRSVVHNGALYHSSGAQIQTDRHTHDSYLCDSLTVDGTPVQKILLGCTLDPSGSAWGAQRTRLTGSFLCMSVKRAGNRGSVYHFPQKKYAFSGFSGLFKCFSSFLPKVYPVLCKGCGPSQLRLWSLPVNKGCGQCP